MKLIERLRDLLGDRDLEDDVIISYSNYMGYEKFEIRHLNKKGSISFSSMFHPLGNCVGDLVCEVCGKCM